MRRFQLGTCLLICIAAAAVLGQTTPFAYPGIDGPVHALLVHDNDLFVGGEFQTAGGQPASCIARWDGTGWYPLGTGLSGEQEYTDSWGGQIVFPPRVNALAFFAGELIAGGVFTTAGATPCSTIARWDGASWSPLGGGIADAVLVFDTGGYYSFPPEVSDLAVFNGELVAGGTFRTLGGITANFVASWDGVAWHAMGLGMAGGLPPRVLALTSDDNTLTAGGDFTAADATLTGRIAVWDTNHWLSLSLGGTDREILALTHFGGQLVAGGKFAHAGLVEARHVALWTGTAWEPLGEGVANEVRCLQEYAGQLYAGAFRWDGASWQNVLQTDGAVNALTVYRGHLVAGGSFTRIGERAAHNIGGWPVAITPAYLVTFTAERRGRTAHLAWELMPAGPQGIAPDCHLWRESDGGPAQRLTPTPLHGEPDGAGVHFTFADEAAPVAAVRYRLQEVAADGALRWLGVTELPAAESVPAVLQLTAFPNPFNPRTNLDFVLPAPGTARLTVHDARGALVAVLRDGLLPAGEQKAVWDGCDRNGRPAPSGLYFARLQTETGLCLRKLILAR
jgi:hypothetical protein